MTSILLLTFTLPPLVVDCCIALLGFQKPSPKKSATTFKPMDFLEPAARRVGSRKKASFGRLIDAAAAISQAHASLLAASNTVVMLFSSRRNKKDQCFRNRGRLNSPPIGAVHALILSAPYHLCGAMDAVCVHGASLYNYNGWTLSRTTVLFGSIFGGAQDGHVLGQGEMRPIFVLQTLKFQIPF